MERSDTVTDIRDKISNFDLLSIEEKFHFVREHLIEQKKRQEKPVIGVVVATHNRLSYLLTYLYSVLLQRDACVKFYISDDASSDKTPLYFGQLTQLIPEYLFYHYNEKNCGPSANRKIALQQVAEELIIFADDDDYYIRNDFLLKAIRSIDVKNSSTPIFFGSSLIVEIDTQKEVEVKIGYIGESLKNVARNLLFSMRKPPSTFLLVFKMPISLKQELLKLKMLNDVSIYLCVLFFYLNKRLAGTEEIVGVYREHSSNITKSLDFNFILDNIEQQIGLISQSKFTNKEKKRLVKKHVANNLRYYMDNGSFGALECQKFLKMLKGNKNIGLLEYLYWNLKLRKCF